LQTGWQVVPLNNTSVHVPRPPFNGATEALQFAAVIPSGTPSKEHKAAWKAAHEWAEHSADFLVPNGVTAMGTGIKLPPSAQ
jgi:hypothetical protein